MKQIYYVVALALSITAVSHAQNVKTATMLEYGIYGAAKQERISDLSAPDGYILKGFKETLVSQTNVVPATVGTKFGFRYSLLPKVNAEPVKLTIVYIFPEMTNPKTGMSFTRHEGRVLYTFGASATYVIYNLDEEWEAVPGKWTFQIWEGDIKLIEKTYDLVKQTSTTSGGTERR